MAAPRLPGTKTRVVRSANYTESLPGRGRPKRWRSRSVIWQSLSLLGSSGQVWDMFDSQFGRQSIDGRGGRVHHRPLWA